MDKSKLENARKLISNNGVIIFPTETAYGLAADATSEKAVEKIYQIKNRPKSKGLTTIVQDIEQAEKYGILTKNEMNIIEEFMPGPLTLVTEKKDQSSLAENLNDKFVFRISSNNIAQKLASETPITATSANISGEETSYKISDIDDRILNQVDLILDDGELDRKPTSTIAEVKGKEIIIHREGPITREELEAIIE